MISAIQLALGGLYAATKKVNAAANNIANVGTGNQNVDLAEEAINLKIAETAYKANIATIKTAEDMSDELMRLFDKKV